MHARGAVKFVRQARHDIQKNIFVFFYFSKFVRRRTPPTPPSAARSSSSPKWLTCLPLTPLNACARSAATTAWLARSAWPHSALRSAHPPAAPSRTPTPHRSHSAPPALPARPPRVKGQVFQGREPGGCVWCPRLPPPAGRPLCTPQPAPCHAPYHPLAPPLPPPPHAQLRRPCWQRGWTRTWCKRPSRRSRPRRYSARPPFPPLHAP